MPTPKLIGRLTREFPSEPRTVSGRGRALPEDLLRQATRRVEIMTLVAAVLWILAPILSHLALYLTDPTDPQLAVLTRVNLIAAGCVVLSLAMYAYLRSGRHEPEREIAPFRHEVVDQRAVVPHLVERDRGEDGVR